MALSGAAPLLLLGPAGVQILTWFLIWVGCLGMLHLGLSLLKGRLPLALFCLLGALSSTGVGLAVLWDTLRANAARSLGAALLWGPGFAIGLFVVGAVGSAAWAALTLGLVRLAGRSRESEK